MNKFKSIYNKNPFFYIFIGVLFLKTLLDTFVEISRRYENYQGVKDPLNFIHDFPSITFTEIVLHSIVYFNVLFMLLIAGQIFKNSNKLSLTKKIILILLIFFLVSIFYYLITGLVTVLSVYLIHPEIYSKINSENLSLIYLFYKLRYVLFSYHGYLHENFLISSSYFTVITYIVFISFSDQKSINYLTKGFLNKVKKLNNNNKYNQIISNFDNNASPQNDQLSEKEPNNKKLNDNIDQIEVFIAKKLNKEIFISVQDIISIHSDGNYVELITHDDSFLIRATLKNILPKLPDFYMKIHRSVLINMNQVNDIKIENEDRKVYAVMENNNELPISRSNQKEFKLKWQEINHSNQ